MRIWVLVFISLSLIGCRDPLVLQTDFGTADGAVAAMKGVANKVDPGLKIYDLTHEIPPYNIWEAAYRLEQAAAYWPAGTVFVSVVDPGVGSERRSVVLKTKSGHIFVSPDNGTLSLVAESLKIEELREINPRHRLEGSDSSYTFHGRDVYAFVGANLAAGKLTMKKVGKKLADSVVTIDFQQPEAQNGTIQGNIPVLDLQFGNVWTNIPRRLLEDQGIRKGELIQVDFFYKDSLIARDTTILANTFADVEPGSSLAYFNSLNNLAFAVNLGSYSKSRRISSGPEWKVRLTRL